MKNEFIDEGSSVSVEALYYLSVILFDAISNSTTVQNIIKVNDIMKKFLTLKHETFTQNSIY